MKVKLVFQDWQDASGKSVYNTSEGVQLTSGSLHSGSVFEADIHLDMDDADDLKKALAAGYKPVFLVWGDK